MPRPTPSGIPSYMRRCVVDLVNKGHDLSAAFAICTATMQKAGYLTKGPGMKQTKKGKQRQRHFSAKEDAAEYDAAYERILAADKKARTKASGPAASSKASGLSPVVSAFVKVLAGEIPARIMKEMRTRNLDLSLDAERVRANIIYNCVNDLLKEAEFRGTSRPPAKATRSQLSAAAKKYAELVVFMLEEGVRLPTVSKNVDLALADCISI
jgi:hypothetical protein